MPADLPTLINAIPTAEDGHVITPDYHNTVRAAIVQLAAVAGGVATSSVTLAYPPIFFPVDDASRGWEPRQGLATRSDADAANGWFPVTLPDKSRLASMTVVGRKFVAVPGALSLRVLLKRISLADLQTETLINVNLRDVNGEPFSRSGSPTQPLIDNAQFQYYVQATLMNAPADLQIDFYAFQFACRLG